MPAAIDAAGQRLPRRRATFADAALAIALLSLGLARPGARARQAIAQPRRRRVAREPRAAARASATAPPLPWTEIARRVATGFGRHRIMAEAGAVTFFALLAIFPALAALVSLYGLFADPATIGAQLGSMSSVLPGGALEVIRDQMTRVAQQGHGKLGFGIAIGVIISLWSANGGTKSLFDALNTVYGEPERRSFVALNAVSLAITVGGILFVLLAAGAVIVVPAAIDFLGLSSVAEWTARILRWPALLVLVAVGLAVIYRFGPNRQDAQWRWITIGGACAALAWLIASLAFSWYAANFASYNATYGSLGAIVGFMMWIWLSTMVILIGGEIDATIEAANAERLSGARR
jgi:membrane protein